MEAGVGGGGRGGDGLDGGGSVFCYVNNVFAPGLDEGVGGLWRVSLDVFSFFYGFLWAGGSVVRFTFKHPSHDIHEKTRASYIEVDTVSFWHIRKGDISPPFFFYFLFFHFISLFFLPTMFPLSSYLI